MIKLIPTPAISGGIPPLRPVCPHCKQTMKLEEFEDYHGGMVWAWFCKCEHYGPPRQADTGPTETKEA